MLNSDIADDECSDGEEDIEELSDHNSESEQSDSFDEEIESERGIDNSGNYCSESPSTSRTLSENIIKFKTGPVLNLEIKDSINVFKSFFTDNMLAITLLFTNQSILKTQQKFTTEQTYNNEVSREELWALIGLLYLN